MPKTRSMSPARYRSTSPREASFEGGFDPVLLESVEARPAPGRIASLLRKKESDDDERIRRLRDLEHATVRCARPLPVQVDGNCWASST